ncbi:MAG: hydroxylamine reductase [Pseudomonadota bacterium]
MYCYQCEQTAKGTGCAMAAGVCGKDHRTAVLQDLLIDTAKNVARYAHQQRKNGKKDKELDLFVIEALFTTVTNVNFDETKVAELVKKGYALVPGSNVVTSSLDEMIKNAEAITYKWAAKKSDNTDDINSLKETILYGLKGMAAYADHAHVLGVDDDSVYAFMHEALSFVDEEHDLGACLAMVLKVGEVNLKVMEMLDRGNTGKYGHPTPTKVRITPVKGKAILVSGHDLKDLEMLLKQTEGKSINIYTHGEMLPCNAYPELKKYKHLVGNFGGAWQNQQKEFAEFPGAILMTTNCIQKPMDSYKGRIFTTGLVQFPNTVHIGAEKNFTPVIEAALKEKGFEKDEPEKFITIGFGRNTVMSVADKVIDAVKAGKIKHFFLIGGCDGAKPGRNYYTEFAQSVPKDCVILTLACGKYRFNKLEFGDIGGIPRLLDMGQCNDAYSAIQVAVALAKAFNTDVNSLPLSMVLSWYEQKAVCILLTLLYLGIKDIRLGPSLPAFVTPNVLNVLVEKFNIKPITTPAADLKAILG